MPNPTSSAIISAARDSDLQNRFVALGSLIGLSQQEIEYARTKLASTEVDDSGNTVASVYEFAMSQPRYRAGEDPTAVTDDHILYALNKLKESLNS